MRWTTIFFLASTLLIPALARGDEPAWPEVFREDFEKGADRWEPFDKAVWKVKKTDRGNVFSQCEKKSSYKPPHRSPVLIALAKDVAVSDFVLDVKALSTHADYGHRDMCVVFGYQDASHFYYVHFGKQADDHANQIFIVDGAARKKISTKSTDGTAWDEKWHHVRIVRKVEPGSIEVFFDDLKTPVMTATDKKFTHGRIGLGSFDDTGDWDDVILRGNKVEKKSP